MLAAAFGVASASADSTNAVTLRFELETLDGEAISSDGLRGQVVLLDFWATWCKPCIDAVPTLREISERHEDDPFALVSISADASAETLERFLETAEMSWPQVHDPGGQRSMGVFGVRTFPTYIVLGPDGRVEYFMRGGGPHIERELEREVRRAVRRLEKASKSRGKTTGAKSVNEADEAGR